MDSQIINEKAQEFKDRVLRITPALFQQFGLVKKNIYLKIDDAILSCIPFDLSLAGASLLGTFSPREILLFEQKKTHPQKLYLSFVPPYTKKTVSYFVSCDIIAFRKPNPDSPYCFVDLKFHDAPFDLKETLVTYFIEHDEAEEFFKTAEATPFLGSAIKSIVGSTHVTVYHDNGEFPWFKILELTPRTIRIFGEFEEDGPKVGDTVELEGVTNAEKCQVYATLTKMTANAEVPGFFFVDLELLFNACIISKMQRFA